jgi:hypothetical protein
MEYYSKFFFKYRVVSKELLKGIIIQKKCLELTKNSVKDRKISWETPKIILFQVG